ncbi:MAG: pectinesterase [Actinomycetota bacterium]|nr:pectinesterase [Actinomycetota bacterium]
MLSLPRGRRLTGCLASAVLVAPLALVLSATTSSAASITVAADGSGTHRSVQAAVSAASPGTTIKIKPGTYSGRVSIPSGKSGISLVGTTGRPEDVVITGSTPQSSSGAAGSATVLNLAKNTTIKAVTIANTYGRGTQALALYAGGDRQIYDTVRILGHQDTLLSWTGNSGSRVRQYVYNSYIEGDVDFIYGNGTLVIDRSTIYSLSRNSSNNGYITAGSTYADNPYGILVNRSKVTGDASAKSVALGRCWHAGGASNATGQVLFRESDLGEHIRQSSAWQDMSGFSWKTCRFSEYANSGAGKSNGTSDRPQLSSSKAGDYTPQRYLAGSDGWNPVR